MLLVSLTVTTDWGDRILDLVPKLIISDNNTLLLDFFGDVVMDNELVSLTITTDLRSSLGPPISVLFLTSLNIANGDRLVLVKTDSGWTSIR